MRSHYMFKLIGLGLALTLFVIACAPLPAPPPPAAPPASQATTAPAAATAPAATTAPAASAAGGPVKGKDTLVMAVGRAAATLDPTIDSVNYNETMQIFDRLIELSADMKPEAGLATDWRQVDPVTWEFNLRKGVKFSNGDDFTCNDAKFTLDRILDPATKSRQVPVYFSEVNTSKCVDDFTFQITTKNPYPAFIERISFFRIVPAKAFQEMGADKFAANPIGSGPYKFVSWTQGSQMVLTANETHWRGAPPIKNLEIRNVIESSTRLAMLKSGEVDFIDNVPPCDAASLAADPNLAVEDTRSLNAIFIGMSDLKPPFDNIKLRQALNYAVDWDEIIKTVLCGYGYRNASSIGALTFGYDPDLKPYPYDPQKAKDLLTAAGFPNGLEAQFDGPNGRYARDKEVSEAVAGYLSNIGVKTKMNLQEFNTFFSRFLAKELTGFYLLGCDNTVGGDFDLCNRLHFHSKVRGIYYNTPKVDALLDEEASIVDRAEREKKLKALLAVIQEEAPWIFAFDNAKLDAHRKSLKMVMRPELGIERVDLMSWQ